MEEETQEDSSLILSAEEAFQITESSLITMVTELTRSMQLLKTTLRSMDIKLTALKKEMDCIRPALQDFLEQVKGEPSQSQSLLDDSSLLENELTLSPDYFVSVTWDGQIRGLVVKESTKWSIKGCTILRKRLRRLLEEIHPISDLRNMTVTGKKFEMQNGIRVAVPGNSIPPLTMEFLYQMEFDRRGIDPNDDKQSSHVLTVKTQVNNLVGKILGDLRMAFDENGIPLKRSKATAEGSSSSEKFVSPNTTQSETEPLSKTSPPPSIATPQLGLRPVPSQSTLLSEPASNYSFTNDINDL